jgi:hypothetical protein
MSNVPRVEFSKATYTAKDTDGTAPIAVLLSQASPTTVTVDYVTADGRGGGIVSRAVYTVVSGLGQFRRIGAETSAHLNGGTARAYTSAKASAPKRRSVRQLPLP